MARGHRGRRRHGERRGRPRAAERRTRGRYRPPLIAALLAVPVGLGLAASLVVTGAVEDLPFQNAALEQSGEAGRIGTALADDSQIPEAQEDDDFFTEPTVALPERPSPPSADIGRESVQAVGSSEAEEEAEEETAESSSGGASSGGSGSGGSAGGGGGGGATTGGSGSAGAGGSTQAAQVVSLVNAERASAGCGALRVDDRLTAAAQEHSQDMSDRGYMSHQSPEGEGPSDRAARHGYPSGVGENVAQGQRSAQQVMDAWMNSQGHRANILNCSYSAIGVGHAGRSWTQKFGSS